MEKENSFETTVPGARMVEWAALTLVVLVLVATFGRYAFGVYGQVELASIQSTVGALRIAMVVDKLERVVADSKGHAKPATDNPFLSMQTLPENYGGTVSKQNLSELQPGRWAYDTECDCIGYKPIHLHWLEQPPHATAIWFRAIARSGVRQLDAMDTYVWQGKPIN